MPGNKSCSILFMSVLFKFISGKQCFKFLKRRLPPPTVRRVNELFKLKCKIAVQDCRLRFLKECLVTGVFPQRYFKNLRADRICPSAKNLKRLTKNNIEEILSKLTNLKRIHNSTYGITEELSLFSQIKFMKFCTETVNYIRRQENERLKKSLSHEKFKFNSPTIDNPEKYVINHSSCSLSKLQIEALAFGLKFCIQPKKINQIESQTQFEMFFDQLSKLQPSSTDSVGWLKAKLVDLEHQYRITPSKQKCPLSNEHIAALKALKANEHLVILKPDKGSGVVLMDKSDYKTKMEAILSDQSKFLPERNANKPTDSDAIIKKEINSLLASNVINEATARTLTPRGSQTPQLYGLPKLHKPGVPLRPILSMVNSSQHQMAKWLADKLKPVLHSFQPKTLKDTFELVELLDKMDLKHKYLASMDITSLFTNVPLEETVQIISKRIEDKNIHLGIPTPMLLKLLRLCTANIKFSFLNSYYRQVDGVAMGSPLGPMLADIFMANLEENLATEINNLVLYRRYVDDILIIATDRRRIDSFHATINRAHSNISVSLQHESRDSLAFLDVLIQRRDDGSIQRSVYRKDTWTGQYLNFNSFAPIQYKRGLVRTLFNRARKICTDDTLELELEKLKQTLMSNGYPVGFIKHHSQPPRPVVAEISAPKLEIVIHLPFRGDDVMKRVYERLKTAVSQTYFAATPVMRFKTTRIPVASAKVPLSLYAKSSCIYQFTCTCLATYVGRTERQLSTRVMEHIPRWVEKRNTDCSSENHRPQRNTKQVTSAITQHLLNSGHGVDRNSAFRIIYTNKNPRLLKFAEASAINKFQPQLCKQRDFVVCLRLPWGEKSTRWFDSTAPETVSDAKNG